MNIVIKDLDKKIMEEFEKSLNPLASKSDIELTKVIAQVATKITVIAIQKVCEELPQQLSQMIGQED